MDYAELIVARRRGRDLTPMQGFLVQGAVLLVFLGLLWLGAASGFFATVLTALGQWFAQTVYHAPK